MSNTTVKTTGRVKWFNKNAGYGFITAVNGDHSDEDIFVHHSALTVSKDQFRYLVEGEYISFMWSSSGKESEQHKWHATDVTGVCGGPLLCETQNESRLNSANNSMNNGEDSSEENSSSRPQRRYRGGGPRISDSNSGHNRNRSNNRSNNRNRQVSPNLTDEELGGGGASM